MANDTDTDVLDSTSADSVLAGGGADKSSDVLAGGGADPGADVSMQDVSGAASQTTGMASPLGGQQPGQLPPMIGQPPAGGVGPGAQQAPVGAGIHARHGGLLTGLAGVLLDGIAAGIMTPQSGQGFSQAAQRAYQMPMERQQNAALMQSFKTQQELDKANIAVAHVKQLQALALASKLSDEQIAGYTDEQVKQHDQWEEAGLVDQIASAPTREQGSQTVHQMRMQDPDQGHQLWMWPTGHDGQGNITGWGIYRMDPDKPIGRAETIMLPHTDPATGETTFKPTTLSPDTPVWQSNLMHTESGFQRILQDAAATEKAQAKEMTDLIAPLDPSTGKRQPMSRAAAMARGLDASGAKISAPEMDKYATAQRQFNDPQISMSQYRAAINEEAALDPATRNADKINLNIALRDEGITEGKLSVPEVGKLELPVVDATTESLDRILKADAYKNLSKPAQRLLTAYRQGLAALPEFQRAMMESARAGTSEYQQGLDMRLWANPIDVLRDANLSQDRMESFQQRIDNAVQGIPDLKSTYGIDSIEDVRRKWEPGYQPGQRRTPAAQPSGAQPAPEGTVVNVQGRNLVKRGGQWVPQQ